MSQATGASAGAARPAPTRLRVVLVDDVSALRRLVRFVLEEDARFEVVGEAANGRDAVEVVARTVPHLVLLDLSMPEQDGLETLPQLRKAAPACKVVVLSGFTEDKMAQVAKRLGAASYIEKGASPDELVRRLLRVAGADLISGGP